MFGVDIPVIVGVAGLVASLVGIASGWYYSRSRRAATREDVDVVVKKKSVRITVKRDASS